MIRHGAQLLPDVAQLGSSVLLSGEALRHTSAAFQLADRVQRREGGAMPALALEIMATLRAAQAVSSCRLDDVAAEPVQATSGMTQLIDSIEAAEILGRDRRTVQRLAADLDGRQGHRGRWFFERSTVEAYAQARTER